MYRTSLCVFSMLLVIATVTGCGDGLVSLTGQLTIDGEPAPAGINLEFTPTDPALVPSYATTDENGNYEAAFTFQKKGIQPGEYVAKLAPSTAEESMPSFDADGNPVASESQGNPLAGLPREYYQGFETFTVESGSNKRDFDLKTEE